MQFDIIIKKDVTLMRRLMTLLCLALSLLAPAVMMSTVDVRPVQAQAEDKPKKGKPKPDTPRPKPGPRDEGDGD